MTRRDHTRASLGTSASAGDTKTAGLADVSMEQKVPQTVGPANGQGRLHISFLLFEGMTALDMIGPAAVLGGPEFSVDYVWRDMGPVYAESESGKRLGLMPTATFADIRATDILCVPGTSDPYRQIMQDDLLEWVAGIGEKASWITSVCTGSFILGAAGLLKGYKATTHWALLDELAYFGAMPVADRVVRDRNRVTGAGVTSGIDFGLILLSMLYGEDAAKARQLILEYDPHPPFASGSPRIADPQVVAATRANYAAHIRHAMPYARQSLASAATRLGVAMQP